ncbi:unnamed protein product [Chrysoparadoxa australica]
MPSLEGKVATIANSLGIELSLLACFAVGLVIYYRAASVPHYIAATVAVSWFLGFCGTLLLPADIADAEESGEDRVWLSWLWQVVYWTTFYLTWLVLPTLNAAWHTGEFTWRGRIRAALLRNLRTLLVQIVIGLACIAYLLFQGSVTLSSLSGFLMASGNTYGLMLIVLLLGHGLVEVPRVLWSRSFPEKALHELYFRATELDMDYFDALYELEDTETALDNFEADLRRKEEWGVPPDLADRFRSMKASRDAFRREAPAFGFEASGGTGGRLGQLSGARDKEAGVAAGMSEITRSTSATNLHGALVDLNCKLRSSQEKLVATGLRWQALVDSADVLTQVTSRELPYPAPLPAGGGALQTLQLWVARALWFWHMKAGSAVRKVLACLAAFLSALIIWSEVLIGSPVSLSPFDWLLSRISEHSDNAFFVQVASMIPFLYMSLCCFRSLFKLRLFGVLSLNRGQSLPGPLLFNAQYLIRLQFPLGYNFLLILRYGGRKTAFQGLMNRMTVVPLLGTSFNVYMPICMVVLCIFTYKNGYAHLLRLVGLEHADLVDPSDSEWQSRLLEGKRLIERAKRPARRVEHQGLVDSIEIGEDDADWPPI